MFSPEPRKGAFPVKLVVSMTSVSPSQWPRESPIHCRMFCGRCGRPSIGMMRIMDLLIEDNDVSGHLDQPEIVVIASWRHGRSAVGSHNAAFRHGPVFGTLSRALIGLIEESDFLFGFGRERGNPAVRRIDHQRSAPGLDELCSAIPPELVVRVCEVRSLDTSVHDTSSGRSGFTIQIHVPGLHQALLIRRCFLLSEERFIRELFWAFHWCERGIVPNSLQVRMTVGQARRSPRFSRRLGSLSGAWYGRQRDRDHDCNTESKSHVKLPLRNGN